MQHPHLALLAAAFCCVRAQAAVASPNYGADYNGLGAVGRVLGRCVRPDSPAGRRVLLPLLLKWVPPGRWELAYEAAMVLGLWAALLTAASAGGLHFALFLAAAAPLTFRYDYWCWVPELGAAAAATSGRLDLALPWFAAAAASKETAPLMPVVWLCYGGGLLPGAGLCLLVAAVMAAVWAWQRPAKFDRLQAARNGAELEAWLRGVGRPTLLRSDMTGTVALCGASVGVVVWLGFPMAVPWLALLAVGWTQSVAVETRVFAALLVPVGQLLASP